MDNLYKPSCKINNDLILLLSNSIQRYLHTIFQNTSKIFAKKISFGTHKF